MGFVPALTDRKLRLMLDAVAFNLLWCRAKAKDFALWQQFPVWIVVG
jgi:hypothetical protein